MNNREIAKLLREIASSYAIKNEKKYRFQIIAYQKAADAIEASTVQAKDLFEEGKLEQLPGVGKSIYSHLDELFKTGRVKHFEWVKKDIPKALFPLLDVPTFGPKKAYKLVKEFNLKDPETVVDEIQTLANEDRISPLEGFGEKSQEDIIQAIKEYKEGRQKKRRMVLPYATEIADSVINYLQKSKDVIKAFPLGSLRRKVATIGDVDIAVSTNNPTSVIKHFVSYPYKERIIEQGETSASILTSSGSQVDLMTQKIEGFGSLLQHFTGSKAHNIHLREYALTKGMSLSEYGIKKKNKNGKEVLEEYDTEEKFYKAIGMDWIPPELRENTGEIELAIKHKLPKLIELKDIKGDLHTHSNFSIEPSHDLGQDSMEDMIKKAEELGYEYLGFSEHNPSISKHTEEQVYAVMSKRKEKIEQLKKRIKNLRIINLLETDILANGDIALSDKSMNAVDALIVSIHSSFSQNKKEMTKRVISGLSHKKAKILAHPTGRILNQREGYELDWDEILEFCKKNKKALEINAFPTRLDLPDIIVRKAKDYGVKIVINTDSHEISQMDLMKFGVFVARRGWAEKDDILNTLSYNEFIDWIKN